MENLMRFWPHVVRIETNPGTRNEIPLVAQPGASQRDVEYYGANNRAMYRMMGKKGCTFVTQIVIDMIFVRSEDFPKLGPTDCMKKERAANEFYVLWDVWELEKFQPCA